MIRTFIPARRGIFLLIVGFVLMSAALWSVPQEAVASRRLIDSHGRDFWITFLPNFHNYKSGNSSNQSDSLYIFVAAQRPTNGVISYRDRNGQAFQQTFSITDPTQIYSFRIRDAGFELEGFNNSGRFLASGGQGERIAPQSFHVTTDDDVTVYALSQALLTSDAFLVLPTDAVGSDYYVMAYTSDAQPTQGGDIASTPSQFAVVATEDSTEVTITPSDPTFINRNAPQRVILNQGDCYLVQAYMGVGLSEATDLTGTRVVSNKPIALFAGHQRATMPQWGSKVSRDVLIEQIPSVDTWGLSAFITPYEQPQGTDMQTVNDLFRVLAAFDNTEVLINGVLTATLSAGGFYESAIRNAAHIEASAPVLVAQFKESTLSGFGGGGSTETGDPFFMLVPPSEQFLDSYRFLNVQAMTTESGRSEITYVEQYVTVIAPNGKLGTVELDGNPVNTALFRAISNSGYSFASFQVGDGVHTVQADTGVGVYVYGYGEANSYGYIGGTNYSPIDFLPPRIEFDSVCFGIRGLLLDDLTSDYHISSVSLPPASIQNVDVRLDPFRQLGDSIRIAADLINRYADGRFRVVVLDSSDLSKDTVISIPGFTVRAALAVSDSDVPFNRYDVNTGEVLCNTYEIVNNGAFPQTITSLVFARATPGFTVQTPLPLVVPPGGRATIELCFAPQKRGTFYDTLLLGTDCASRPALAFNVVTGRAKITLQVLNASANPGKFATVKIKLIEADGLDWTGVNTLTARLRFDASMLVFRGQPAGGVVTPGDSLSTVVFPLSLSIGADSIVASLRFYAGLTNDSTSELVIDSIAAVDGEADINVIDGQFFLTGICYEGGVRLLNPSGRIALAIPRPHPAEDIVEIDVETVEAGRTRLEVVDLVGRTVAVAFDGELESGLHVLSFEVGMLGAGSYHLVLKTPTETLVQRLEVVR